MGFSIQSSQHHFYCNLRNTIDSQKTFHLKFSQSLYVQYYFVNEKFQTLLSPNIITMLHTYCSRLSHPNLSKLFTSKQDFHFALLLVQPACHTTVVTIEILNQKQTAETYFIFQKPDDVQDAFILTFLKIFSTNFPHSSFMENYQASATSWHQNVQRETECQPLSQRILLWHTSLFCFLHLCQEYNFRYSAVFVHKHSLVTERSE